MVLYIACKCHNDRPNIAEDITILKSTQARHGAGLSKLLTVSRVSIGYYGYLYAFKVIHSDASC